MEFTDDVAHDLTAGGWYAARQVTSAEAHFVGQTPHPAVWALANLDGLQVGSKGAGKECARSEVTFKFIETSEYVLVWARRLNTRLVGLAEVDHGYGELYMDAHGRCFVYECVGGTLTFAGETLECALRVVLFGLRTRPMLAPGEYSVTQYGRLYQRTDPEIYHWE